MADRDSTDRQIHKWDKRFYLCIAVSFAILFLQTLLDIDWLDWPRAACWVGAGVASIKLAQALRRAGQDGAAAAMRGLACFGLALVTIV